MTISLPRCRLVRDGQPRIGLYVRHRRNGALPRAVVERAEVKGGIYRTGFTKVVKTIKNDDGTESEVTESSNRLASSSR